jgi:hypothetical protein
VSRRVLGLWVLVLFLGLLGAGTINNQLRINQANALLARQARNGQLSLDRTCRLLPVSKKIYADMVERHVITVEEYDLVLSTANTVCPP